MKKLLSLITAVIMMFAFATTAMAANITITETGTSDVPSSALVDALADESREDGDVITLPAGYFTAPTEIEQSVTIVGAGSTRTTEDTTAITTLVFSDSLDVNADDITFTLDTVNLEAPFGYVGDQSVIEIDTQSNVTLNVSKVHLNDNVSVTNLFATIGITKATSPIINIENSYFYGKYAIFVTSYVDSDYSSSSSYGRGYTHDTTDAKYTINDSYIAGWTIGNMRGEDTVFKATDSTFHGYNNFGYSVWNSYSTFVMTDGAIDGSYTFNECKFITEDTTGNEQNCIAFQYGARDNVVYLNDCTYEMNATSGAVVKVASQSSGYPEGTGNDVVLDGTTYADLTAAYYNILDEYLVPNGTVAIIGAESYTTLNDAVVAAQDGEIITLLADLDGSDIYGSTLSTSNTATIDLNGHNITAKTGMSVESGTLTIIDEIGSGKLIIPESMTLTNEGELVIDCDVQVDGTILNKSSLTILGNVTNNGTINNLSFVYGTTVYYFGGICIEDGGILDNKGSLQNGYDSFAGGLIEIENGATFTNTGTLTNKYYICIYDGADVSSSGIVTNTGGFEYDYLPATEVFGSVAYYVSPWEGVDYYEFYPTLAAAIADADDTVVLIKGVTEDISVNLGDDLTLDLNGYKVDGDISNAGSGTLSIVDSCETGLVTGSISKSGDGAIAISGGSYTTQPATSVMATGYTTVLDGSYYIVKVDLTQTKNFGSSDAPYTTIVEGSEYFAEPTVVVEIDDVDVTLEGNFTYSYGDVTDGTYDEVIAAMQTTKPTDDFIITYSYAASGNYAGTVTGTIYFDYSAAETVVYSVLGNTIYAKLGDTLLGTLYISAPTDLTYDGSAKYATIVDDNSGILGSQTIVYNTTDGAAPTNAGTYTASVTTQGCTASITFAISRESVVFTVENNVFEQGSTLEVSYTNTSDLEENEDYTVSYTDADGKEVDLDDETPVGNYTIVITITDSNYKLSGTVGSVVVYEDDEPEAYTLTYEEDGGTSVADPDVAIATTVRTLEATPTYDGYTFAGWTYNGKIYTAEAEFVQPAADVTMKATWIANTMKVSGIVTDKDGAAIEDATVTLVDDTTYTTTDANGYYEFTNVAAGTYTISVEYKSGEIKYTSSREVSIKEDATVDFEMQDVSLSTKVLVEDGLEAKSSSNLYEVAAEIVSADMDDEDDTYAEFTSVEVNLLITSANDETAIEKISNKTEDVGYTVDISVEKVFDNTVVVSVPETPSTIEIEIALPTEIQGMATYKVYRYHNGSVDILTTSPNSAGEYIVPMKTAGTDVDGNAVDVTTSLIIHAKYFSTYAIAATDTVASSGSSVKKYSNDLEVGDGGSAYATPLSASSGTTVYINVSPNTGYEVDEVTVDGGDITVTDCEDGSYSYKQPAYAVDIEVTFQADGTVDEEEVEEEVTEEETTEALTDFDDVVAGAWYEEYVAAAVEAGIMQGNSETEFAPNGTTTRAMMIQVLFNMSDEPETENDEAAWYSEALAWGVEFGITDGSEITGNLTREQLVTMLYRYAMSNGVDVSAEGDLTTYGDYETVADWATDAFTWACGEGIINGSDGNLNPQAGATRAELAKIMVSYLGL